MIKNAVVQIWRGVRGDGDSYYLASGVLIAPTFVITARHVVTPRRASGRTIEPLYPAGEIFVTSYHGAFDDGGPQGIREVIVHPTMDIVLLRLRHDARNYAEFTRQRQEALQTGAKVMVYGYGDPAGGIGTLQAQVSSYGGTWDLHFVTASVQPGYSGGPVCQDDRLVGLVLRRDSGQALLQAINDDVYDFISDHCALEEVNRRRPISEWHLEDLRRLLIGLPDLVTRHMAEKLLRRVIHPGSLPAEVAHRTDFDVFWCLDWLRTWHHGPNDAPVLVYLGACRRYADLSQRLSAETLAKLNRWEEDAISRIGISLTTLEGQIEAALKPPNSNEIGILFVKVAPDLLDPTMSKYFLDGWVGYRPQQRCGTNTKPDWIFEPIVHLDHGEQESIADSPIAVDRADLLDRVTGLVVGGYRRLHQIQLLASLRVEIMLPFRLFDWNPAGVQIPHANSLTAWCPVVLRSWERNYCWRDDPFGGPGDPQAWRTKCQSLPPDRLMAHQVHCLADPGDLDVLAHRLRGHVWALVAPLPGADGKGWVSEALLTGLSEGLPMMLWPLVPELDGPSMRQTIVDWICGTPHERLPELLHEIRRSTHPEWQGLAALWDDPRQPLPDDNYPAYEPD